MINTNTIGKKKQAVGWEDLCNVNTGEIKSTVKMKLYDIDIQWEKVWVSNLLYALGIIGDKSIKILMYFIDNRNYENKVIANKEIIVRHTKISHKTVYKVVNKLLDADIIRELELGYQVNPHIIFNSLAAKKKGITRLDIVFSYFNYDSKSKKEFIFETE